MGAGVGEDGNDLGVRKRHFTLRNLEFPDEDGQQTAENALEQLD